MVETDNTKCEGIVKLINDVKAADGTRLDAFGMQAHYSVDSFSATQFKTVAENMQKLQEKYSLQSLILNQVHLIHQVWQQKRASILKLHIVINSYSMRSKA